MARNAVFIDTWGWVALGNRRDEHHKTVKEIYKDFRHREKKVFTSDYVMDELITLLFRREEFSRADRFIDSVLSSANLGHTVIERVTAKRFCRCQEAQAKIPGQTRDFFHRPDNNGSYERDRNLEGFDR